MKQTTKYVGLDVHQATTVAVVGDETGRVIAKSVVPTEETALLEFIRGCAARSTSRSRRARRRSGSTTCSSGGWREWSCPTARGAATWE
jgi:hypothetical protein